MVYGSGDADNDKYALSSNLDAARLEITAQAHQIKSLRVELRQVYEMITAMNRKEGFAIDAKNALFAKAWTNLRHYQDAEENE